PLGDGMILLKGAAYLALQLPVARGRHSGDVDLLFPRERLPAVETRLLERGWAHHYTDEYTQSYYRRWMHELPPLRQPERLAAVDIHHNILPLTSRIAPDPTALIRESTEIPGLPGLRALCAPDMTIHLALHFAHDGDFDHSLREAIDLDDMLRHFGTDSGFWSVLLDRADLHGAHRPLHYAIAVTRMLLGTPVPEHVVSRLASHALPSTIDRMIRSGMVRCLADTGRISPGLATTMWRQAFYIRSHWLRMPPPLLALHLTRQAARRLAGERSAV
ncbi:MAG: nucleotidyltransferase family protein, partial [Alphaproteobacteria bacterium]|nr:nucleotidyltransferase family protein [Alphaproteobacteria bacterium]